MNSDAHGNVVWPERGQILEMSVEKTTLQEILNGPFRPRSMKQAKAWGTKEFIALSNDYTVEVAF